MYKGCRSWDPNCSSSDLLAYKCLKLLHQGLLLSNCSPGFKKSDLLWVFQRIEMVQWRPHDLMVLMSHQPLCQSWPLHSGPRPKHKALSTQNIKMDWFCTRWFTKTDFLFFSPVGQHKILNSSCWCVWLREQNCEKQISEKNKISIFVNASPTFRGCGVNNANIQQKLIE